MSLLLTFPGRFGDLLWALPTVRAIAEQRGLPVDLAIAGEFASIAPLLRLQPYIKEVYPLDHWSLTPPDEWRAPVELKGTDWDEVIDLGYRGWPDCPLPYFVAKQAKVEIDLSRPWITVPTLDWKWKLHVAFGFSECWFELKHGLIELLFGEQYKNEDGDPFNEGGYFVQQDPQFRSRGVFTNSRWTTEAGYGATADWIDSAQRIQFGQVFFGDCSALHVLAVAMGKPVVICEPMDARWNEIFYPLGMDGPQVTVVKGHDGLPTFDARACAAAIEKALSCV